MIFSSSRSTSATLFRNLNTSSKSKRGQSSEPWERATGPLIGPAKPQVMPLTWRGCGALEEPCIAISSEPSKVGVSIHP